MCHSQNAVFDAIMVAMTGPWKAIGKKGASSKRTLVAVGRRLPDSTGPPYGSGRNRAEALQFSCHCSTNPSKERFNGIPTPVDPLVASSSSSVLSVLSVVEMDFRNESPRRTLEKSAMVETLRSVQTDRIRHVEAKEGDAFLGAHAVR
jgi:hypothetical protein